MFDFCPHCGQTLGQEQLPGRVLSCLHCGRAIGTVAQPGRVVNNEAVELIDRGAAARCPDCEQLVGTKTTGTVRSFVPHQGKEQRKICPQSGKALPPDPVPPQAASPIQRPATTKDLSAYIKREVIKVVACTRAGKITIEELVLEVLDRKDRVRLQIDALRELLGAEFRLGAYPAALGLPHLAVWGNVDMRMVAQKHPEGGYQAMTEEDLKRVVSDLQQQRQLFFA